MSRRVLLVVHTGRADACASAKEAAGLLAAAGITVCVLQPEADELAIPGAETCPPDETAATGAEIVLVFGGDGTILRAAEHARPAGVPLLGVNLGRMGFLAESEPDRLDFTVDHVLRGVYTVEERATIEVTVADNGDRWTSWALNEVSVEKANRERMVELVAEVDGKPLARYGCDGLVVATATGSTAYAFSAGGPIVAPDVAAVVLVPISAHGLFARPIVLGPQSRVAVEVLESSDVVVCCDGRRTATAAPGGRIEVGPGGKPVLLARVHAVSFTDRLVAKFELPVEGWRGKHQRNGEWDG